MFKRYSSSASLVKTLLWVNGLFFVLQQLAHNWFGSLWVERYFSLHIPSLQQGKFWTPLTYSFLHGNFDHILLNSLGLFFIGRMVEPLLSRLQFWALYLGGGVCGGFLWMALNWHSPFPLVGASAAVMALLICFCRMQPNQPVTLLLFFLIPITVKPKWILWGTLAFELWGLLFSELQKVPTTHISHSAHLGGFLWGVLFQALFISQTPIQHLWQSIQIENPRWASRRKKFVVIKEHLDP